MRRTRRGALAGHEFGGSGEDSFVAVVVTKLTGALLFILLLAMVIMALIPRGIDRPRPASGDESEARPLAISTPEVLPEAIAGRPYAVALAATGGRGRGPLRWAVEGPLPEGLAFDVEAGQLHGTPRAGVPAPVELVLRVSDGEEVARRPARLVVYQPDTPLALPSRWRPALPPIPWRAWAEHGVGFLMLGLVALIGLNAVAAAQRLSAASLPADDLGALRALRRRCLAYRAVIVLGAVGSAAGLAAWLVRGGA